MKRAGTFHGDLIVVDRAAEIVSGRIVVASVNGERTASTDTGGGLARTCQSEV